MDKNLQEIKKITDRIMLLMTYSPQKTLFENLSEQTFKGEGGFFIDKKEREKELETVKKREDDIEKKDTYPNYCKYPNKTVIPTENEYGLKGINAIPDGFCAYSQPTPWCKPSKSPKEKTSYIILPKDTEIEFFNDFIDISDSVDEFWNKFSSKEKKLMKKKEIIQKFTELIPFGTVKGFTIGPSVYEPHMCHSKLIINSSPEFMSFGGYKNSEGVKYLSPTQKDERTPRQKFVDQWGTTLQWTTIIATAISGLFCEGCTFPLVWEIAIELGVNSLTGFREWEKGDNVSATLSGVFAILPFFKTLRSFRGIDEKYFLELSEAFKKSGLTKDSTPTQWIEFYNNLSSDAKIVINQIVRTDEYTRKTFLGMTSKELGEELASVTYRELKNMLKQNPSLIKKVALKKRLWFRELGTNIGFYLASLFVDVVWGDKLNKSEREDLTSEMKDRLDGIYTIIPDYLKEEITMNLFSNLDKMDEIVGSPKMEELKNKGKEYKEKNLNNSLEVLVKTTFEDTLNSVGSVYEDTEISFDTSKTLPDLSIDDYELEKLKKNGWQLIDFVEWDKKNDTIRRINDDYYIKKPIKK